MRLSTSGSLVGISYKPSGWFKDRILDDWNDKWLIPPWAYGQYWNGHEMVQWYDIEAAGVYMKGHSVGLSTLDPQGIGRQFRSIKKIPEIHYLLREGIKPSDACIFCAPHPDVRNKTWLTTGQGKAVSFPTDMIVKLRGW